MDYSHAYVNLVRSQNPNAAVKEWVEAQKRPYAKLMRGFMRSSQVAESLQRKGYDYQALSDANKVSEGIVFTYGVCALLDSEEKKETIFTNFFAKRANLTKEVSALHSLNIPIVHPFYHEFEITDLKGAKIGCQVEYYIWGWHR